MVDQAAGHFGTELQVARIAEEVGEADDSGFTHPDPLAELGRREECCLFPVVQKKSCHRCLCGSHFFEPESNPFFQHGASFCEGNAPQN